ncbi:MAG: glycosyl transferase [Sclerophora amabilis]|nr:MAG: glycosyl transferase [Sclerophora amabilis]
MADLYPSVTQCAIVAGAFKVLLFPAYKSTDFEVHRNWLAITNSLPVKEWYFEETSEWTLDYPPFFAYFEWVLSQFAPFFDPALLEIKNLNYSSWQTVYFQRLTVIITELVLVFALNLLVDASPPNLKKLSHATALSIILSPGLLIIDHIHFQYNGFLYGILVLSLFLARKQSTLLYSGLLFAVLLCLKHIYLYLAPAYFVYLLRAYCLGRKSILDIRFVNAIKLGTGLLVIFGSAFGPFVYWGQLNQLLGRLFPFSRGLCHAYWAPNIWAMYSFVDRVLLYVAPRIGLEIDQAAVHSVTRGLVGDTSFAVLPEVSARTTFALTLFAQIVYDSFTEAHANANEKQVCLIKLFRQPTWETFVGAVTLCSYASFLFGWHVHEKAILLVIIPFRYTTKPHFSTSKCNAHLSKSLLALKDRRYLGAFRPLAVSGHVSLFPLVYTAAEFPIKTIYTIFWLVLFLLTFDRLAPASSQPRIFLLDRFSLLYTIIAIPLILYCSLFHGLFFGGKYEFLPLMFTSSYSAIGVVGSWLGFLIVYL